MEAVNILNLGKSHKVEEKILGFWSEGPSDRILLQIQDNPIEYPYSIILC